MLHELFYDVIDICSRCATNVLDCSASMVCTAFPYSRDHFASGVLLLMAIGLFQRLHI